MRVVAPESTKPERFAMRDARAEKTADNVQLALGTLTEVIQVLKTLDPMELKQINTSQPLDVVYTYIRNARIQGDIDEDPLTPPSGLQLALGTLTEVINVLKKLHPVELREVNTSQPLDVVYTYIRNARIQGSVDKDPLTPPTGVQLALETLERVIDAVNQMHPTLNLGQVHIGLSLKFAHTFLQ